LVVIGQCGVLFLEFFLRHHFLVLFCYFQIPLFELGVYLSDWCQTGQICVHSFRCTLSLELLSIENYDLSVFHHKVHPFLIQISKELAMDDREELYEDN